MHAMRRRGGGARPRIATATALSGQGSAARGTLGIRDSVEFVGWIRDESGVAAFWSACDVAVAAPNDWIEAFGLTAVEAMACGVPVVATRGGALPETVVHERTGFLVDPRDTKGLAAALLAYFDDASLVATRRGTRDWCEQRFDIQRCADAYARLFRDHATPGTPPDETTRVAGAPEEEATAIGPRLAP